MDVDVSLRPSGEIAKRAIILSFVMDVPDFDVKERVRIRSWLKEHALWADVSPNERSLFGKSKLAKRKLINASWRVEALEAIFWSLGTFSELTSSSKTCSPDGIRELKSQFIEDPAKFVSEAKTRSEEEIFNKLDEIYNQHWSIRDARIHSKPIPDNLQSGVVMEKHYALNWVTNYENQDWDSITTDT